MLPFDDYNENNTFNPSPLSNPGDLIDAMSPQSPVEQLTTQSSSEQAQSSGEHRCGTCSKTFPQAYLKRKHEKQHIRPIKCPADETCTTKKAEPRDMYRHLWTSHKPYAKQNNIPKQEAVCNGCGQDFTRKDNLGKHIKNKQCKGKKDRK